MSSRTLAEIMQILSVKKASDIIINGGDVPLSGGPVSVPSNDSIDKINGTKGYAPISDPNDASIYNATNKLETVILYINSEEFALLINAGASRSWNKKYACGM